MARPPRSPSPSSSSSISSSLSSSSHSTPFQPLSHDSASSTSSNHNRPIPTILCSNCGTYCPLIAGLDSGSSSDNERRIAELEAQVILLKRKAAEAEEQLAEYKPKAHQHRPPNVLTRTTSLSCALSPSSTASTPLFPRDNSNPHTPLIPHPPPPTPLQARFGALLQAGRKLSSSAASTTNLYSSSSRGLMSPILGPLSSSSSSFSSSSTSSSSVSASQQMTREADLASQLAQEQALRRKAEDKLLALNAEVENLSVSVFQEANVLVAKERRERHRLEQRIAHLEGRETARVSRLEKLEGAVARIERVRKLLYHDRYSLHQPDDKEIKEASNPKNQQEVKTV